ncbi:hypothetical protein [Burkholderia ubonensis]|uniref:Uncharacterized protein n=1 Tax=Burkholderia ubonensis subsp. mesacidophila TaxID=265293 RepID=A0A2A4FB43_9BURK|nr:hypothetical protein [Burkholderia ubonensis]PCE30591.1 hypothetical protein BZL54_20120 [Burkholderia ubonensis subsp. mesacidophila]
MRELKVSEAKQISGAGLVIAGDISGNSGTSWDEIAGGASGTSINGGVGIGIGANVTINGRPVPPTSSGKNGVGVSIGHSGFDVSKFTSSFFKFKF